MTAQHVITAIQSDRRLDDMLAGLVVRSEISVAIRLNQMLNFDWEPDVTRVVGPLGWYVTRASTIKALGVLEFCLEPLMQQPIAATDFAYHASPREYRESIQTNGLTVSSSSSTWTNRRYSTPRIHLAASFDDALTYIESRATGRAAVNGITRVGAGMLTIWDIYRIRTGAEPCCDDAEMDGGLWTNAEVPPDRWQRLPAWFVRLLVEFKIWKYRNAGQVNE